jgi:hypothetical protein
MANTRAIFMVASEVHGLAGARVAFIRITSTDV